MIPQYTILYTSEKNKEELLKYGDIGWNSKVLNILFFIPHKKGHISQVKHIEGILKVTQNKRYLLNNKTVEY